MSSNELSAGLGVRQPSVLSGGKQTSGFGYNTVTYTGDGSTTSKQVTVAFLPKIFTITKGTGGGAVLLFGEYDAIADLCIDSIGNGVGSGSGNTVTATYVDVVKLAITLGVAAASYNALGSSYRITYFG